MAPSRLSGALQPVIDDHLGTTFPALALAVVRDGDLLLDVAWGWLDPETQARPVPSSGQVFCRGSAAGYPYPQLAALPRDFRVRSRFGAKSLPQRPQGAQREDCFESLSKISPL